MEFPELKSGLFSNMNTDLLRNAGSRWAYSNLSASIKSKPIIDELLGKDTDGDNMEKSYMDYAVYSKLNKLYGGNTTPELRKTMGDEYKRGLIEGREIVWKSISVDRIIFNDPATIVFWKDGTKTVVKCQEGQTFNPYFGFCAAIAKKLYGNNSRLNRIVETYLDEDEDPRKDRCAWCVNSSKGAEEEPCTKCKVNMQNENKKGLKNYWEGVK